MNHPLGKIKHTGIKISGTGKYDGEWGFNPDSITDLPAVLMGHTVKGRVFADDGPYYGLRVASRDPDYIREVFMNIQESTSRGNAKYNLYGQGKNACNCYEWRDNMLQQKKANQL